MHGYYGHFTDGLFGIGRYGTGGIFVFILGIVLVGAVLYFAFKKGSGDFSGRIETPLELLQKKYINGEISQEEFIEKKEVLSKK